MLQIADLSEYSEKDIPQLLNRIKPILNKRKQLHKIYCREANQSRLMYQSTLSKTILPFEKFITDLATGYSSGKPSYTVDINTDKKKQKLLKEIFKKKDKDKNYSVDMTTIIEYITSFNDDEQENHDLFHDIFELTSCYEVIYENEQNEIVYSKYDPLQTVATWDYNIPANLTGLIRYWKEKKLDGTIVEKVEITDKNGTRQFSVANMKEVTLENETNHEWGDVPAIAVETDYAIFETCEDVIKAYEQLVQNVRDTYQYNDEDCKMMVCGYSPENQMVIVNEQGEEIPNPAREIEDKMWKDAKTIYVGENGEVKWLSKPVDSEGIKTMIKTYADLMFQLAGIPNTSDLAFNSTDLNASAIDRKFYIMNMITANTISLLKKAYLRRWELIFGRINKVNGKNFDFRDIKIELPKNLPSSDDDSITSMKQLVGLISNQTIVEKLGYNYKSEKEKLDAEGDEKLIKDINKLQGSNIDKEIDKKDEDIDDKQGNNNKKI